MMRILLGCGPASAAETTKFFVASFCLSVPPAVALVMLFRLL